MTTRGFWEWAKSRPDDDRRAEVLVLLAYTVGWMCAWGLDERARRKAEQAEINRQFDRLMADIKGNLEKAEGKPNEKR